MKQNLVLAVFAFAIAVASSTWFVTSVMPPRADDSAPPPAEAPARPATASVPAPASGVHPVGDTLRKDSLPSLPPVAAPGDSIAAAARAKAVAKIMASMKPKDAAAIVANLSDDELERIIRQLNAKQVAALLTVLPKERAAAISRRLLDPGPAGKGIGT